MANNLVTARNILIFLTIRDSLVSKRPNMGWTIEFRFAQAVGIFLLAISVHTGSEVHPSY